jgi:hypothetical protein
LVSRCVRRKKMKELNKASKMIKTTKKNDVKKFKGAVECVVCT